MQKVLDDSRKEKKKCLVCVHQSAIHINARKIGAQGLQFTV